MPKYTTTNTPQPPSSTNSILSSTSRRPSRSRSIKYKGRSITSVLQDAHDIVFKRTEDQWNIHNPTALDSPRTSATTTFFKMDQRNMDTAAPVDIHLPAQVKLNVEKNLKNKQHRMMMGMVMGTASSAGKNSVDQNHHRMRIAAPAGKNRSRKGSSDVLQNRFASRRSYIPMAQETPAMREVRIERHRKKQFSQQDKKNKQEILNRMKQSHIHTSHIQKLRKKQPQVSNVSTMGNNSGIGSVSEGRHTKEELERNKTKESEAGNREMQVLSALMKKVAGIAKFYADENIARSVMTEVDQDEMSGLRRGFEVNPGGLTLAQFIELMMGFVPISEEEEHEIQKMHKHHHHHLHHKHHHKHHTNNGQIVHVKGKARLQLARNLCELFEQIDINGDGTLEWDEFTSYCVSQGLANDLKTEGSIKRYKLLRSHHCYNQGVGVVNNMATFILKGDEWNMAKANVLRMARQNFKHKAVATEGGSSNDNNNNNNNNNKAGGMTFVTCDRNAIHKGTFSMRDPRTGKLLKRCGEGVHKNSILAVCYIPCMEYIVTSSADLTLGFWDSHKHDLRQLMPVNEEMLALHWVNSADAGIKNDNRNQDSHATNGGSNSSSNGGGTTGGGDNDKANKGKAGSIGQGQGRRRKASVLGKIHSKIRIGTLYTGGISGNITGWDVAHMFVDATLVGHTDSVTSFLSIKSLRLLVSSSMDSTVRIWNLRSNAPLKVLRGHARGISSVAFSIEQRVLLSCGFDHEIFVWNPYVETRTSGKLRGHTCSVLSVTCVEGTKEAISVDVEGNMRIWDLRTLTCVQILADHEAAGSAGNHLYDHVHNPNTPNPDMFKNVANATGGDCLSWCYIHHPDGNRIMVATERYLRVYAYNEVDDPRVADINVSNSLVYNPLTSSFLTAGGQSCKNWDAVTGKLLHSYDNIIEEDKVEITAVCYDDQYRQFLLGDTLGRIRMYQCANGQLLRDLVSHSDGGEVIAIMFNRVTDCIYSTSSKGQLIAQEDDGEGTDEQNADENAIVPPLNPMADADGDGNDENVGREAGELFRMARHEVVSTFTRKAAPPCETTALVQGPSLGLLAWGAVDGDVAIIDCVSGHTEGMCIAATIETDTRHVTKTPVTALTFLEPYPLLAVAYGNGSICIWSVRPFYIRQCPLMVFYNYKKPKIHLSPALAASAPWIPKKEVHSMGETVDVLKLCWDVKGKCLLAGDGNGSVLKWNLRYMLLKLRIREFHQAKDNDSHVDDNPKKLGDVLHPDLKRTTMSAREQLEESLAANPREFDDPESEDEEDKTELAGLSWLGKIRRRADESKLQRKGKRSVATVKSAVRLKRGPEATKAPSASSTKSGGTVREAELTTPVSSTHEKKAQSVSTFALTEVESVDQTGEVTGQFIDLLASGKSSKVNPDAKIPKVALQTAASRRTYGYRAYAAESRSKSKLQHGKLLSGDAAQLVDAKPCHQDAVCELHILQGLRAIVSSGQDHVVLVRSLDAVGGTLDSDDDDDDADSQEDVLGHLWQGFPDPKWRLGPLVKKQMEKNLTYELKRASAILKYMDDRDAQYQKINQQFFAAGNKRRGQRGGAGGSGDGGDGGPTMRGRKGTMAMMLGTKIINGQKQPELGGKCVDLGSVQPKRVTFHDNINDNGGNMFSAGSAGSSESSSHSDSSDSESSESDSEEESSVLNPNGFKDDAADEDRRYQALNPSSSKMNHNGPLSHRDLGPQAGIHGAEMLRLVMTQGVRPPRARKARFQKASMRLKWVSKYMRPDLTELEERRQKEKVKKERAKKEKTSKAMEEQEDVASYVRKKSVAASSMQEMIKKTSTTKKEAETFLSARSERNRKFIGRTVELKKKMGNSMNAAARRQAMAQKRTEKASASIKQAQGEMAVLW